MSEFTESVVEDAALAWLESLGYAVKRLSAPQNATTRQAGEPDKSPTGDTRTLALPKGEGGLMAAVSAKNALAQTTGNMQKMHITPGRETGPATTKDYLAVHERVTLAYFI